MVGILQTNNVIHWRTQVEQIDVPASFTSGRRNDISVGILDSNLPPSVGYLPTLPTNLTSYLPTNNSSYVQGIGMNQDMKVFSQPMTVGSPAFVDWDSRGVIPFGLGTNWSLATRGGDSSAPARLLVGNQLVLLS